LTLSNPVTSLDALSGYVEKIDTRAIHETAHPLRKDIGSLEELMTSILRRGLLEPIVVRPSGKGFEVVAGSRRLEACKRLKIRFIDCHVVELCDRGAFEVSLTENIQRQTLSPLEEAEAFKRYVNDNGYGSESELARRIGKSQSYVSRRISLLDLPDNLKREIMRQRITPSAAAELSSLDDTSKAELSRIMMEMGVNRRSDVRRLARRRRHNGDSEDPSGEGKLSNYQLNSMKTYRIDRILAKCAAAFKEDMGRFDDAVDALDTEDEDSWIVREALLWHRRSMSAQADYLLRLRKKFRRAHDL
jgi:ParB family transcriptional regulator, chromosome partitioning protein